MWINRVNDKKCTYNETRVTWRFTLDISENFFLKNIKNQTLKVSWPTNFKEPLLPPQRIHEAYYLNVRIHLMFRWITYIKY